MEDKRITDLNETIRSATVKHKLKKLPTECKICGASALYSYVGVIVCPSCKVFFRRNAQTKQGHFQCLYEGHCDADIHYRHICSSCRLAKCFASGMQTEMLRSTRTTKNKPRRKTQVTTVSTILITQKEKDQSQQLPTLNLLRSDQSMLSVDQWNCPSNLTHCFDEHGGFLIAQRFIQEQNELPHKMRFKLAAVADFFTSLLGGAQLLFERNLDFTSLCSHDRSILLHNTMKYVSSLSSCFITRHTRLLDNAVLYKSGELLFGSNTLATSIRAVDQFDFDGTFFKVILALLTFSTLDYTYYTNRIPVNLMDIKVVLRIQDMYTELAWRYLIYKYDHKRSVIYFSNLIRFIFSVNDAVITTVERKQYTDMIDSIMKQTEETLTLD